MNATKLNFWLDVFLGVAFMLALLSGLMAQPVHEKMEFHFFAGISVSIGVVTHLVLHRKWIATAVRPGKKTGQLTVNAWLNQLLGVTYLLTPISGLYGHRNPFDIDPLHVAAATSMTIILLVHLARHRKWIVTMARRYQRSSA